MLPLYRGLFSPNNSRKTPIARPLGRGMVVVREFLVWPWSLTDVLHSNLLCCLHVVLHCTAIYRESIVYPTSILHIDRFSLDYEISIRNESSMLKTSNVDSQLDIREINSLISTSSVPMGSRAIYWRFNSYLNLRWNVCVLNDEWCPNLSMLYT